ncbi:hypothetical protein H6P81_019639 [Aristolochia fimbriata]|uniref:Uncharacterized protein n=1 Tax=Aristolochia fimbriata TaxID=158543 RepID=A0AAV7DSI4_ARIFI|nr:hypothetical protein H6P81_019639 [Aristolochia fimbriata]
MDRVGRKELPDQHQRREEADPEGDHHRCPLGFPVDLQGIHLARRRLQRIRQRGAHRQGCLDPNIMLWIDVGGKLGTVFSCICE